MKDLKQAKAIITALNSTNDLGFKYPIGNKELTIKVRELESKGIIYYSAVHGVWMLNTDRRIGKGI